jgi:hypothetical protein
MGAEAPPSSMMPIQVGGLPALSVRNDQPAAGASGAPSNITPSSIPTETALGMPAQVDGESPPFVKERVGGCTEEQERGCPVPFAGESCTLLTQIAVVAALLTAAAATTGGGGDCLVVEGCHASSSLARAYLTTSDMSSCVCASGCRPSFGALQIRRRSLGGASRIGHTASRKDAMGSP